MSAGQWLLVAALPAAALAGAAIAVVVIDRAAIWLLGRRLGL